MTMKTLYRKAGEPGRADRAYSAAGIASIAKILGALAGLALFAAAAHAETRTPRTALEQQVQGLIAETIRRHAARPVAEATVERDARRLAASLSDRELREASARGDATVAFDAIVAKAAAAPALGDPSADLLFVPVPPCRIIDTRLAGGGILTPGTTYSFRVTGVDAFQAQGGQDGGCGIPAGAATPEAAAVVINFVAVGPQGPGDMRAWPYGQPKPTSSIINYANVGGLNIANGLVVPISGVSTQPFDINVSPDVSGAYLVADVTGYFTRFPIDTFNAAKPATAQNDNGAVSLNNTSLASCLPVNSCTMTVNVTGHVVVQTWAQVVVDHTQGIHDRVVLGLKNSAPTACTNFNETVNAVDFEVPDVVPTDAAIETVLNDARTFFQSASDGAVTYYVNAAMGVGASAGDQVVSSRIICTFFPD
jgi:hypothetical protein